MSQLRPAIIFNDQDIFLEITEGKFRQLLKDYYFKYKDLDEAVDAIIRELKAETRKV